VDMSSVSHVSEVYAISNFRIEVSRVGETLVISTLIMEAANSTETSETLHIFTWWTEQCGLAVTL
jgi:hypothetical protein